MLELAGWSRACTVLPMRMHSELSRAIQECRHFSSSSRPKPVNKSPDQHELPAQSTLQAWLQAVRAVLFPITVQQPIKQVAVAKPATKRLATHPTAERTIPRLPELGKDAQNVVGNLFKASIVFVTLPLAGSIGVNQLLIPNLVTRLRSDKPHIVQKAMADIQFYVRFSWLASIFEGMDGTTALLQVIRHPPAAGVWSGLAACLIHVMKFESTRDALLMGDVVGLLEQALTSCQIPPEHIDTVYAVYLDYHAIRRQHHEMAFATVAPGIDKPLPRGKIMPLK